MEFDEVNGTAENLLSMLPPAVIDKLNYLFFLSKITLYVIIGYMAFLFIKSLLAWRRHAMQEKTYYLVREINAKLDILMKKKTKKEVKSEVVKISLWSKFVNLFKKKEN
jgi:hypothetical protein